MVVLEDDSGNQEEASEGRGKDAMVGNEDAAQISGRRFQAPK